MTMADQNYEYTLLTLRSPSFQLSRSMKNILIFLFFTSVLLITLFSLRLYHKTPVTCPTTSKFPDPTDSFTRSIHPYNCKPVRTEGDEFSIWLCMSSAVCYEGHFIIQRRDQAACRHAEYIRTSENATTELYAKHHVGPDLFHATFEGAEKLAIVQQEYLGGCTYKLPFHFSNAGKVTYQIKHIYRQYDYLNELREGWPPIVLNRLSPQGDENVLDICPTCPTAIADPIAPEAEEPRVSASLPLCSRGIPVKGAWLPAAQIDRDGYKHSKYAWTPLGCQMPDTFEVGSGDSCITKYNRSILFVGDSHVRVTFDGMARRLKGDTTSFYDIIKWVNHTEQIHNVTLEYQAFDPYLNDLLQKSCEDMLIYDTIYFNMGHWPASGLRLGGHWTTHRFTEQLVRVREHLVKNLRSCRKSGNPLRLIWQGNNFFPLRNDDNVRNEEDWRTPARLKYWDDIAERIFDGTPIARMNSYRITASMGDTTSDGCHYNGADALDAIINEGLHKINFCSPMASEI